MIDNPDMVGYGVGGLGLVSLIAQGIWTKFFSSEGSASSQLVDQQAARITALEARQATLESRVNDEMAMRLAEQERNSVLRRRVKVLEEVIVELGGTVPPEEH